MSNGPTRVSVTAATAENEPDDEKEQVNGESPTSQAEEEPAGRGQGEAAAAETPRRPISPLGRGTSSSCRNLVLVRTLEPQMVGLVLHDG